MENIWVVVIPSLLVVMVAYYFFNQMRSKNHNDNSSVILPLRIQAYERMTLFLERIKPENMVLRMNNEGVTVSEMQALLLQEIRNELNHNVAQQVYISSEAWDKILDAVKYEQLIIQQSGSNLSEQATSKDYIYSLLNNYDNLHINAALNSLKSEVQKLF